MPAQRRPAEPSRVADQEQDELERVREAGEVELGRRYDKWGLPLYVLRRFTSRRPW